MKEKGENQEKFLVGVSAFQTTSICHAG